MPSIYIHFSTKNKTERSEAKRETRTQSMRKKISKKRRRIIIFWLTVARYFQLHFVHFISPITGLIVCVCLPCCWSSVVVLGVWLFVVLSNISLCIHCTAANRRRRRSSTRWKINRFDRNFELARRLLRCRTPHISVSVSLSPFSRISRSFIMIIIHSFSVVFLSNDIVVRWWCQW